MIIADAQNTYPKDYFRSPIDIPIFLAGNFGEIRSNHFHAGLDIKTEGVEGKNIYAVAEGYVSRIKIAHGGYGKVLYLTHPNGYTTTYAHLQRFSDNIEKFVRKHQYKKESFEIELYPGKKTLTVEKGQIIAISGNTGGSGGPHLHFEIRETKSETPINPALFGFKITDTTKPKIKRMAVYPIDSSSSVFGKKTVKVFAPSGKRPNYTIPTLIYASGKIGFGLEVQDFTNGSSNRCGAYSIELIVDSQTVYKHQMEKINFQETRYINSHVDYYQWHKKGRRIQRSFIQPNNKLNIYSEIDNGGILNFVDTLIHSAKYIVMDVHGNTSELDFKIQSQRENKANKPYSEATKTLPYNQYNSMENEDVIISMPKDILYDNINFEYSKTDTIPGAIAPLHNIHHLYEPLHKHMTIAIRTENVPKIYRDKALIVSIDKEGGIYPEGGTWNDNHMTVKTRSLGSYTVMIDSIKPKITPLTIFPGKNMGNTSTISFKIQDNLSGINSYYGTVDGDWILMEYDYKTNKLTYTFDEHVKPGSHQFKLTVTDKRDNTNIYEAAFTR